MSRRHPIIVVTGSSGAGTSTVKATFDGIFRREGITAAVIEGDAFHKYSRTDMKAQMAQAEREGVAVRLCSRCSEGQLVGTPEGLPLAALGLNAYKARITLMLELMV